MNFDSGNVSVAKSCNFGVWDIWQGVITEDVVQLRKYIGAPGMAVLQFGIINFV